METNRTNILQIIKKCIDDTFNELDYVKNMTSAEEKKLISLTLEYANVQKEISDSKKEINLELNNLERDKQLFKLENDNFKNEVTKFNEKKSKIEIDLQDKINTRKRIGEEIEVLSKKLESLNVKIQAKETLTSELESISRLVSEKRKEFKELQVLCDEKIKSTAKTQTEAEKLLKSINEDIEQRRKAVLPTINMLEEREKKVKEREDNINIIIERYKKLYADKGVGFRV